MSRFPCTIAYDTELRRPACVILQRGLAATISGEDLHAFPPGSWLLAPTDNMAVYPLADQSQLDRIVAITEAAMEDTQS